MSTSSVYSHRPLQQHQEHVLRTDNIPPAQGSSGTNSKSYPAHSHGHSDRVLHPLGHGQTQEPMSHYEPSSSSSAPMSGSTAYNRQLVLMMGGSDPKAAERPGSATSGGGPAVGDGMVKTSTTTTTALVDAFEVVAQEIGAMRMENAMFKTQKEQLEEKVEAQVTELKHIRLALVDMERAQERVRREYEEEIGRLKRLLGGASVPPSAGGSRYPASRRPSDIPYTPPTPIQQSGSGSLGERDPKRFRTSVDAGPPSGRTSRADNRVPHGTDPYLPSHQLSQVAAGKQPYRSDVNGPLPQLQSYSHPPPRHLPPQLQTPLPPPISANGAVLPSYSNGWANYESLAFEDLSLATLPPESKIERPEWYALYNPDPRLYNGYAIHFGGALQRAKRSHPEKDPNRKQLLLGEVEGHDANGNAYGRIKEERGKKTLRVDLVHTFPHNTVVCCVQFSADGRFLATGCNRTAQIYDVETGKVVAIFKDTQAPQEGDLYIRSIRFSPDSMYLATGAEDRLIRVWHIESRRIRYKFSGHTQEIYSLDYSNDGRFIVSGSGDRTMRIWDVSESVAGGTAPKSSMEGDTSAGGNKVIWVDEEDEAFEKLQAGGGGSGPEGREGGDSPGRGHANSRSPNNNPSSSRKKRKRSADAPSSPQPADTGLTSISISPSNQYVAAGSLDSTIRIYSLQTGVLVAKLRGHTNSVYSVKWAAYTYGTDQPMKAYMQNKEMGKLEYRRGDMENEDENTGRREVVYSGSLDKSVWGWDLTSLLNGKLSAGKPLHPERPVTVQSAIYTGHKDFVLSVAASPDGEYIISGSKDRCVHFIDTQTGLVEVVLGGHKNSVISLDVVKDSRRKGAGSITGEYSKPGPGGLVATGSGDSTARIWSYTQITH